MSVAQVVDEVVRHFFAGLPYALLDLFTRQTFTLCSYNGSEVNEFPSRVVTDVN